MSATRVPLVHSFEESLRFSESMADEGAWIDFYRKVFGRELVVAVSMRGDSEFQRKGIDRQLNMRNGNQITVDEKVRRAATNGIVYDDFLCEEWSVLDRKPGWSVDPHKQCDLIAYAIPPLGKCMLLPYEILRLTCQSQLPKWKLVPRAYPKDSNNGGYVTRNCAVSWDTLFRDMRAQMERKFSGGIALPTVAKFNGQLLFEWP